MWRVLTKVMAIVREEMDREGGQEILMPIAQPREIWEESGRWERYTTDGIMFHFEDRKGTHLCLGPTHEEVVTTWMKKRWKYSRWPVSCLPTRISPPSDDCLKRPRTSCWVWSFPNCRAISAAAPGPEKPGALDWALEA